MSRSVAIVQRGLRSLRSKGGFRESSRALSRVAASVLPAYLSLYVIAGVGCRVHQGLAGALAELSRGGRRANPEELYKSYERLLAEVLRITDNDVWEGRGLLADMIDTSVRLIRSVRREGVIPEVVAEAVEHEVKELEALSEEVRSARNPHELRRSLTRLGDTIVRLSGKLSEYMKFLTYVTYGLYSATGSEVMHAFSVVFYALGALYRSLDEPPTDLVRGLSCILTASAVVADCALRGQASEADVRYAASYSLWALYFMNALRRLKDSEWIKSRYDVEALFRDRNHRVSAAVMEAQLFKEVGLDAIRHVTSVTDLDLARGVEITREEEREWLAKLIEGS